MKRKRCILLLFSLLLLSNPFAYLSAQTDAFYYNMYSEQKRDISNVDGNFQLEYMEIEEVVPLCDGSAAFMTYALLYVVFKRKGDSK